jgi:hypothetical protein
VIFRRPDTLIVRGEVEATMWLIADLRNDVRAIRRLLEEEHGEEEETEPDS